MEEERDRNKGAQEDEQDVEAHRTKAAMDESEGSDPARKADEDEPDVEAHRFKA